MLVLYKNIFKIDYDEHDYCRWAGYEKAMGMLRHSSQRDALRCANKFVKKYFS
jgi:hypothetical protein